MGASSSTSATTTSGNRGAEEFRRRVNLIAANFIMTPDFKRFSELSNEDYCKDLTILTRDLLAKKFTTKQINYLAMGDLKKDSVLYISKNELAAIESGMRDKKKTMCNGIARFYVRIAHVFSAIYSTVSPNWKATIENGSSGGPPDFCKVRIETLLKSARLVRDENGKGEHVSVQPTVCSLYASESSSMMTQPGFPDLEPLYNDIYDFEKGVFNQRSANMSSKYESDLNMLFSAFTGSSNKPDTIKRFSDINIASLAKRIPECGPHIPTAQPAPVPELNKPAGQDPRVVEKIEIERVRKNAELQDKYMRASASNLTGSFTSPPKGATKQNGAFSDYVGHVKTMMNNADRSRTNLLKILDKMFLIVMVDSAPKITIHPSLTSDILDSIVNETRDQIMQLYMGCERDFYTGMKLLRVIVEEKMQENMEVALIKLKADTRAAIQKVVEQKRQTADASPDKSGMFSTIKDAVFSTKPYDVIADADAINKDREKQESVGAATNKENNAKEELVSLIREHKDIDDEIANTNQMIGVITKKKDAAQIAVDSLLLSKEKPDSATKVDADATLAKIKEELDTANKKKIQLTEDNDRNQKDISTKQGEVDNLMKMKTELMLKQ